ERPAVVDQAERERKESPRDKPHRGRSNDRGAEDAREDRGEDQGKRDRDPPQERRRVGVGLARVGLIHVAGGAGEPPREGRQREGREKREGSDFQKRERGAHAVHFITRPLPRATEPSSPVGEPRPGAAAGGLRPLPGAGGRPSLAGVTPEPTRLPEASPPSEAVLSPPMVSVITPAHDAARFLDETIRSVAAQTFRDWEMIIVDDDSGDGTQAIVERWAASEPRIRLFLQSPRQGAGAARNRALEEARGRFVAFLDSDDVWRSEKLEVQVAFMRETGAVFSFDGYSIIDEQGKPVGRPVRAPARADYRSLLRNTIIGCLTVMLDRVQLGPLRMPALPQHED